MFLPMSWMSPWTVARRIWGSPGSPRRGEVALEHLEGPLGRLAGAHQQLGQEEGPPLKALPHLVQGGDQLPR